MSRPAFECNRPEYNAQFAAVNETVRAHAGIDGIGRTGYPG
jgi:hypothetical protein